MTENDHEHKAFEEYAKSKGLSLEMHPLHLLYLDEATSAALEAFKAGYASGKDSKKAKPKKDWNYESILPDDANISSLKGEHSEFVKFWVTDQCCVLTNEEICWSKYWNHGRGLILREALEYSHDESPSGLNRRAETMLKALT